MGKALLLSSSWGIKSLDTGLGNSPAPELTVLIVIQLQMGVVTQWTLSPNKACRSLITLIFINLSLLTGANIV